MKLIIILILYIYFVNCNIVTKLTDRCVSDSNCKMDEYCDKGLLNPFGKCKEGLKNGELCLQDSKCASKRCSYFICKERIKIRDGPCKVAQDCPNDQFCDSISGTDDLKKCVNRKCKGVCTKNSECSSNNCHLLICVNDNKC